MGGKGERGGPGARVSIVYLTILFPERALAIIISYPTSVSGIIVSLKTPQKYRKLDYNKNKKAPKITHMPAIFVDHGVMAHIR